MSPFALAASVAVLFVASIATAQNMTDEYEQKRNAMIASWKELFGSQIDFSKRALFNSMSAVGARPLTDFKDFKGVERTNWLKRSSDRWMQAFLKEDVRPTEEPAKYYVRQDAEPSVLFYKWQAKGYQLAMYESPMAVLLVVASQAGEAIQPTASEFHQLLATLLNIDSPPRGLLTEAKLEEGDVVTTLADLDRVVYSDWRDAVIAFGSKQGVCILLLKADPERASPNLPDAPNWLSDGLTTVDENQRAEE